MTNSLVRWLLFVLSLTVHPLACADDASETDLTAALPPEEAAVVHEAVDRGLKWLSTQQNLDGSFKADNSRAPIASGFAVMAFLSRGHLPGQGEHGEQMTGAIDYLLSLHGADGSFALHRDPRKGRCHAIAGATLSEVYGATSGTQAQRIRDSIPSALRFSRKMQLAPKRFPDEQGGWRLGQSYQANIHQTVWELMFLRSARNNGFDVPQEWVDEALTFVEQCYVSGSENQTDGVFQEGPRSFSSPNFGRTGMGMLALQLHGRRDDHRVIEGADWLAKHDIPRQGEAPLFYLHCYACTHAMAQMGGDHWQRFYPRLVKRLLADQAPAGFWRTTALTPSAGPSSEALSGNAYNTALAVLALTLPDQLLPIHQR